jgi:hypothetical protein
MDAEEIWWGDVCRLSRSLLAESGIAPEKIRAIGISALGCDCVPVDENGKALMKAIMYGIDSRAQKEIAYLNEYYGDEAGLCGFTDPDCRRTYPWGREDKELIRFHRELIRMRKETSCLRNGSLIRLTDAPGMLSYGRFDKESSAVVIVNNRETPMKVRIPVIYAGVPADANMKLRFQTRRNGFLAYPRTIYRVRDGILRMEMPPESAAVLLW